MKDQIQTERSRDGGIGHYSQRLTEVLAFAMNRVLIMYLVRNS